MFLKVWLQQYMVGWLLGFWFASSDVIEFLFTRGLILSKYICNFYQDHMASNFENICERILIGLNLK